MKPVHKQLTMTLQLQQLSNCCSLLRPQQKCQRRRRKLLLELEEYWMKPQNPESETVPEELTTDQAFERVILVKIFPLIQNGMTI